MKASEIRDDHVVELAAEWQRSGGPGVVARLVAEGIPVKLARYKVEQLVDRGRLDYGVSLDLAWPAGPMCWRRSDRPDWCAEHERPWRHEGERLPADYPPRPRELEEAQEPQRLTTREEDRQRILARLAGPLDVPDPERDDH